MTERQHLADVVFTEAIPRELIDGVLYVSMEHATAIHACMCGCGREVVTPFRRDSWRLSYDGVGISLSPSIGNGALRCRSHYFIRDSKVVWLDPEERRSPTLDSMAPMSTLWRLGRWLRRLGGHGRR